MGSFVKMRAGIVIIVVCALVLVVTSQQPVYVGGFFPTKKWPIGPIVSPAMDVAFEDINGRADILPNFQLIARHADTECNPAVATAHFQDQVAESNSTGSTVAIVGGGCDVVSLSLGIQNGPSSLGYQHSVPIISWGSTSQLLSDSSTYPYFQRVVGPNTNEAAAIIVWLKSNGWERVGLLSQPGEPHNSLRFAIKEAAASSDITIVQDDVFSNSDNSVALLPASIEKAKKADIKIFILIADADVAAVILKGFGDAGLAGVGNQWIGSSSWAATDLTSNTVSPNLDFGEKSLLSAYQTGAFGITVSPGEGTKYILLRDKVNAKLQVTNLEEELFPYTGYVYDAAFAVGVALHDVLEVQKIPQNDPSFQEALHTSLRGVVFDGVTGVVSFDQNGDRPTDYAVFNNRPFEVFPFSAQVATISVGGEITRTINTVIFGGGVLVAPVDGGDDNENGEPGSPYWIGVTLMLIFVPIFLTSACGLSTYVTYRHENFQKFD